MSRPTPDTVLGTDNSTSLIKRVRMANCWPANYFISIHANANLNTAINGTELYIYRRYTQPNWLAEQILDGIVETFGIRNNSVRVHPTFYVLKTPECRLIWWKWRICLTPPTRRSCGMNNTNLLREFLLES